jgi:hypothetical protein
MAATVSDFLVERLRAWGVRRVFGYPGDGINGVVGALARATDEIRFIQARHRGRAEISRFAGRARVLLRGLEAIVDPNVPPLPPHITLEQARNYLKAILKGDPDAMRIIKASVKEMLA